MQQKSGHRLVVLDTNAFGGAVCGPQDLDAIKRLNDAGARVIVPDVVVHELCSHIEEQLADVNLPGLAVIVGDEAVERLEGWRNSDVAFSALSASLEGAGAEVSSTPPQWWKEALLDEIHLVPPTSKSGKVKTGAVDAIVAKNAVHGVTRYGSALVVTSDRILKAHLDANGINQAASIQEAIGLVADNADLPTARGLAMRVLDDPDWRAAFAALIPPSRFNDESLATLETLGFGTLSFAVPGLLASVVFRVDRVTQIQGPDEEVEVYFQGSEIWSAETLIDTESLSPTHIISALKVGDVFNYANYPGDINELEYAAAERISVPAPYAQASFDVSNGSGHDSETKIVHVRLGDDVVARVRFGKVLVEMDSEYGSFHDELTDIEVTGPLNDVPATRSVTTVGYLGARMIRLWAERTEIPEDSQRARRT